MGVINWLAVSGILVDLVIISMIISYSYWGYRKGLVAVIFKVLVFLLSLLIVFVFYKPFANMIISNTNWDDKLTTAIQSNLEGTTLSDGKLLDVEQTNLASNVVEMINKIAFDAISTAKTNVIGHVAVELSHLMIRAGSVLFLLIISRFFLLFIRFVAELIANLPIIKLFNKTGGLAYGIIKSFFVVYLVLAVFSVISPLISSWGVITAINNSRLGSVMYNNNIILNFLMK